MLSDVPSAPRFLVDVFSFVVHADFEVGILLPEYFHFANYRFSFRFVSLYFVSQTTVSRLKALYATGKFNQAAKFRIKLLHTYPEPAVFVDSMLSIRSLFAILFVFGLWDVSPVLYVSTLGPCHLSSLSGPMLSLSIVVILGEPVVDSRYLIDSSG